MGNFTYRLNRFAFFDRERIQKYLEAMAQKGWMLDQTGATLWRYRKESPRKIHVSILYVADGSTYNPAPTSGEDLLEELSADNGWQLLARWGQMQIFYSDEENPPLLETDPVTQVETIRRCMKKSGIPTARMQMAEGFIMAALMLFQLVRFPIDYLSQEAWFWCLPDSILIVLMGVTSLVSWQFWYRKASEAAQEGRYISVWNARWINLILGALSWILTTLMVLSFSGRLGVIVLSLLMVFVVIAFVRWLTKTMKESGVKAKTNIRTGIIASVLMAFLMIGLVCFISIKYHMVNTSKPVGTYPLFDMQLDVFADEIPLRVEDLTDTQHTEWSTENMTQESFLIANHRYRQWALTQEDVPEMDYQVIEVKIPWVYTICKNGVLDRKKNVIQDGEVVLAEHYEPIDSAPWGAQEAYREYWNDDFVNRYVVCYENNILVLNPNWELTDTQKAMIGRKFS